MITCKICNASFKSMITGKHLKQHNITTETYKKQYGDVVTAEYRQLKSNQSSGANNPNYGKKHSQETKNIISEKNKGKQPHNKGTKMTDKQKKNLSDKAIARNKIWNDLGTNPNTGSIRSEETKQKIRSARKKQVMTSESAKKAIQTKKDNGYDLAFFRGKTHTKESIEKIKKSSELTRRAKHIKTVSKWIEFAVNEGFEINAVADRTHWNVTCPGCNSKFDITLQYFSPSKYRGQRCINCDNNYSYISKGEQEIYNYVCSLVGAANVKQCDRSQIFKELDIFVPSASIAIEYCGLYWHSDNFKDKKYHLDKVERCIKKGIQLITIFEDEWHTSPEIVKSVINSKLGKGERIHARECIVKEITSKEANIFVKKYHLQGSGRSNHRYGLFHNDDLVSVMTFSNSNISRRLNDWEINRFCTQFDTSIIGGASKLFKKFMNDVNPESVISYADRRWSDGAVYEKMNFTLDSITPVNQWYWKPNDFTRYHRYSLRKNKDNDQNLTEYENRSNQGWLRIWDCGNLKYVWRPETIV